MAMTVEVLPYSGELKVTVLDADFSPNPLPINLARTHNGKVLFDGPLGIGWQHSHEFFLADETPESMLLALPGQVLIPLTRSATDINKYHSSRNGATLVKETDKQIVHFANGIVFTFSLNGLLTRIDLPTASLQYSYEQGRLKNVMGSLGDTIEFSYSKTGKLTGTITSQGDQTTYSYDDNHRLNAVSYNGVVTENYDYDESGRLVGVKLNSGETWKIQRDELFRVSELLGPKGVARTYAYEDDAQSEKFFIFGDNGGMTRLERSLDSSLIVIKDVLGGVIEHNIVNGKLATSTDPLGRLSRYTFDPAGRLTEIVDPLGRKLTRTYFEETELVASEIDYTGQSISTEFNDLKLPVRISDSVRGTRTLEYDSKGRIVRVQDFDGQVTKFEYDQGWIPNRILDQRGIVGEILFNETGKAVEIETGAGIWPLPKTDFASIDVAIGDRSFAQQKRMSKDGLVEYEFDAAANIVAARFPNGSSMQWRYDLANNITQVLHDSRVTLTLDRNPMGMIVGRKFGDKGSAALTYDAVNRLTGVTYASGRSIAYQYNPDDSLASVKWPSGERSFNYSAGKLSNVIHRLGDEGPGAENLQVEFDYAPNMRTLRTPYGDITQRMDGAGRLIGITTEFGAFELRYGDEGLVEVAYPNGTAGEFQQEATEAELTISSPHGTLFSQKSVAENDLTISRISGDLQELYVFDPVHQIIKADLGTHSYEFVYDQWGNRIREKIGDETIESGFFPDSRQIVRGGVTFAYDSLGRRIRDSDDETERSYSWSPDGRLNKTEVIGRSIEYQYDPSGLMTGRKEGLTQTRIIYDRLNPLLEIDRNSSGELLEYRLLIYGQEVDSILAIIVGRPTADPENVSGSEFSTRAYFLHRDERNNVILVTDQSGSPVASYRYDPFGNLIDRQGSFISPFLFAAQRFDRETGLYYMRARHYDPANGVFLSRDPLLGNLDNALSTHPYIYALNDPISLSDPLGLFGTQTVKNLSSEAINGVDFTGITNDAVVGIATAAVENQHAIANSAGFAAKFSKWTDNMKKTTEVGNQLKSKVAGKIFTLGKAVMTFAEIEAKRKAGLISERAAKEAAKREYAGLILGEVADAASAAATTAGFGASGAVASTVGGLGVGIAANIAIDKYKTLLSEKEKLEDAANETQDALMEAENRTWILVNQRLRKVKAASASDELAVLKSGLNESIALDEFIYTAASSNTEIMQRGYVNTRYQDIIRSKIKEIRAAEAAQAEKEMAEREQEKKDFVARMAQEQKEREEKAREEESLIEQQIVADNDEVFDEYGELEPDDVQDEGPLFEDEDPGLLLAVEGSIANHKQQVSDFEEGKIDAGLHAARGKVEQYQADAAAFAQSMGQLAEGLNQVSNAYYQQQAEMKQQAEVKPQAKDDKPRQSQSVNLYRISIFDNGDDPGCDFIGSSTVLTDQVSGSSNVRIGVDGKTYYSVGLTMSVLRDALRDKRCSHRVAFFAKGKKK
ncbi:MAG: RHS repeat-associated core domain-containing protein [Gammaproteobacteria bacterium]|nr:RHS repeat-associated core domain-containing protein [Gammaproteobacteria bacterium]